MSHQELWLNVINQALRDAAGDVTRAPKENHKSIQADALRWLVDDEFAEQREFICSMAGVGTQALGEYLRRHGLGKGLDMTELREIGWEQAVAPRVHCESCGVAFVPVRDGETRCREDCGVTAPLPRYVAPKRPPVVVAEPAPDRDCKECGASFTPVQGSVYCSAECRKTWRNRQIQACKRKARQRVKSSSAETCV